MASGTFRTKEVRYSAESSLAENAETPSSNTFTTHIPCLSVDARIGETRIRDSGYRSRMNDENLSNLGIRTASLDFETYLIGHLTTTAGSLTQTWLQDLLSDGLGGGSTAMVGTTVSSATTASSFTLTSTSGLAVGMVGRIGAKGDGRGDGQAYVVSSVGAPTTSLVALPGTPSNTDVAYATQIAYHDESVAATLGTKRFTVAWPTTPTAGQQFQILGAQLGGLAITIPLDGGLPRVRLSYTGTYWARSADTIPSAVAQEAHYTAPAMGGSCTLQDVGTSTRTTITPAELELSIDLGLAPVVGPGATGARAVIVGWQRTRCQPMLRLRVPWDSAYETYWRTVNQSITAKHILFNGNTENGRNFGFYMPNCIPVDDTPSMPVEHNEQRYVDLRYIGRDSTVTTTELTRSAIRIWTA